MKFIVIGLVILLCIILISINSLEKFSNVACKTDEEMKIHSRNPSHKEYMNNAYEHSGIVPSLDPYQSGETRFYEDKTGLDINSRTWPQT